MTVLSALAAIAGAAVLMFLPLPKDRVKRLSSQGFGTVLFASGLVGTIFSLMA